MLPDRKTLDWPLEGWLVSVDDHGGPLGPWHTARLCGCFLGDSSIEKPMVDVRIDTRTRDLLIAKQPSLRGGPGKRAKWLRFTNVKAVKRATKGTATYITVFQYEPIGLSFRDAPEFAPVNIEDPWAGRPLGLGSRAFKRAEPLDKPTTAPKETLGAEEPAEPATMPW